MIHHFNVQRMGPCTDELPGFVFMSRGHRRRGGPPFGHFGGRGFFGPGRRAGRGDIRSAILALLSEQPMHGYQIIRELSERSGGLWQPSPGSVYPTLQQLQDEDLVRSQESDGGKRVFELTDAGRLAAEKLPDSPPWEEGAGDGDDALIELRELAIGVMAATRQVVQAGAPAQLAAAREVLRDARRRLYGILAEDDAQQRD
jgi:DNA-binding PadR family transcriptional regulator